MNDALANSVETSATIVARARKAAHAPASACSDARPRGAALQADLDSYRFVDNVWTFFLQNATITVTLGGQSETVTVDKAKIISVAANNT